VNGTIATETFKSQNGNVSSVNHYDERGLLSTILQDRFIIERRYDASGNLTNESATANGEPGYLIEYKSDNHENPESQIPKFFKGIPDPILTIQRTEGGNNLTYEKFTTVRTGNVVYLNNTEYQYNASGLPESSVMTQSAGNSVETTNTTFRYKCQ
jgi:YD repeat-containing protein